MGLPEANIEQPTGQIPAAIQSLSEIIDKLHFSVGHLQKGIAPVLRPEPPKTVNEQLARAEGTCELADLIIDQYMRLRVLIDDVDMVTARIEL